MDYIYPIKFPTNAAKKSRPADPALQLYGGSVMISEIVLNETIPAVQPNANWIPASTIFGNRNRYKGRRKYWYHVVLSSGK